MNERQINTQELVRLHERLDKILEHQRTTTEDIAVIKTKLELWPKPEVRPCSFFQNHIKEHEKAKTLWQTPAMSMAFDFVRMAIVGVITWLIVRKNSD